MDKKSESFPTNPEKLPWPQDIGGITAKLRREGCRSIGRMNGIDRHYNTVMDVLRVLAKHAEAKLAVQKKLSITRAETFEQKRLDRATAREGDRVLKLRNLAKDMEHMKKQYDALNTQGVTPSPVHTVKTLPKTVTTAVSTPPKEIIGPPVRKLQSDVAKSAGLGLPKVG